MAEEYSRGNQSYGNEAANGVGVHGEAAAETKDRGVFDFLGKKGEEIKPQHQGDQVTHAEIDAHELKVEEEKRDEDDGEKKKQGFLAKLHRSNSSSSSSSDEEEAGDQGEEKKKKKKEKKGLKEKIKEKITGEKREEHEDTVVPVEKSCGNAVHSTSSEPSAGTDENNKGFLEKIKEKLPGHDDQHPEHPVADQAGPHEEEKKGIFEKIKEKLPGYHPKNEEDKEKEAHASH